MVPLPSFFKTTGTLAACPTKLRHLHPASFQRLASRRYTRPLALRARRSRKGIYRAKGVQARGRVVSWRPSCCPCWPARGADAIPPERSPFQVELLPDGTFSLLFHRVPLVTSAFKFWAANWKWANPTAEVGPFRDGVAPFDLRIPSLAAEASGTIDLHSPEVHHLRPHGAAQRDATGRDGGRARVRARHEVPLLPRTRSRPTRCSCPITRAGPGRSGPDREIKVVFTPGVKKVYFENNNKGRIRAFFVGEANSAGTDKLTDHHHPAQRDRAQTDRGRGIRPRRRARGSPTSSRTHNPPSISPRSTISRERTGSCARRETGSSSRTARRPASGAST